MDDDHFEEILNEYKIQEYNPRIVFTVISIFSLLANLANVVRIVAWKHLRSNITYMTILHVCITHIMSMIFHNYKLWFYADFTIEDLPTVWVLIQGAESLNFGLYLLMILMLCLWYTSCYCAEDVLKTLRRYFLVCNVLVDVIVNAIILLSRYYAASLKLVSLAPTISTFVLLVLLLVVAHSYRCYTRQQTSHPGLSVAGLFVVFWTPSIISAAFDVSKQDKLLLSAFVNSSSIGILAYLWKYDFVFKNDKGVQVQQENNTSDC